MARMHPKREKTTEKTNGQIASELKSIKECKTGNTLPENDGRILPVYVLDWYCFHDRLRKNFQLKAVVLPGYYHIEYIGYAVNCQKYPKHSYG